MKTKLDRVISIATLAALVVTIVLLVKKPSPVAQQPQAASGNAAKPQSIDSQSVTLRADQPDANARQAQPTQAPTQWQAGNASSFGNASSRPPQPSLGASAIPASQAEDTTHSEEISAAVSQLLGGSGAGLTPDTNVGAGAPNIKDQKVTYDGDTVHGQFLTEIAGKDVWITISGHMGQKDGYATFDPTEFKVGNMNVPVSLVNPALQRKLAEERDRLKIAEPK
jgi:hypothetical protein